jgi:hypothetical protein
MANVTVLGVLFKGRKQDGDFQFMVEQPEHANSVFVICENYMDMLYANENGGGTAALRTKTWPIAKEPRAVGIPTGWSQETGGFRSLIPIVRTLIDLAVDRVVAHIIKYPNVNKVIYSADGTNDNKLGVGIFKKTLSATVCNYMSAAIRDIPQRLTVALSKSNFPTVENLRDQEILAHVPAFIFGQVIHERDRTARIALELQKKMKRAGDKRPADPASGGPSKRNHTITSFVSRY